jgi:hypothetical protein
MGCVVSKDVPKPSGDSTPITEAGVSVNTSRISNQKEITTSANIDCGTTNSVQAPGLDTQNDVRQGGKRDLYYKEKKGGAKKRAS